MQHSMSDVFASVEGRLEVLLAKAGVADSARVASAVVRFSIAEARDLLDAADRGDDGVRSRTYRVPPALDEDPRVGVVTGAHLLRDRLAAHDVQAWRHPEKGAEMEQACFSVTI